jgi:hypothetical protein
LQELAVTADDLVERMATRADVAGNPARVEQGQSAVVADGKPEIVPLPAFAVYALSIVLDVFSVTTSVSPFGVNDTWAGPELPAPSGCVEPESGASAS